MRFVVPFVLLLVGLIHAVPVAGVLGPDMLSRLYGVAAHDADMALLLRHRAVLFGIIAAFLAFAAAHPQLHRLALVVGFASVVPFLALASLSGPLNSSLVNVVRVDEVALGLLVIGAAFHALQGRR